MGGGEFCHVRLDRALATPSWSALFPFASVEHLTTAKSDHSPIVLSNELEDSSLRHSLKKPFRYECAWETDDRFDEALGQAWEAALPANSIGDLAHKLNNVAKSLKRGSRQTFGSVRQELRDLRQQLAGFRADPLRVGPGPEEKRVQDRIVELSFREEVMMRQWARVKCLSEGDANTKYFQKKASARKAKNKISNLVRGDGTTYSDPQELADMTSAFYENLYTSEGSIGIEEVLSHIPQRIDAAMNARLNARYSSDEVKEALFQMFPTKAPGPDGFPEEFYKKCWHIGKGDLLPLFNDLFAGQLHLFKLNFGTITLLSKKT